MSLKNRTELEDDDTPRSIIRPKPEDFEGLVGGLTGFVQQDRTQTQLIPLAGLGAVVVAVIKEASYTPYVTVVAVLVLWSGLTMWMAANSSSSIGEQDEEQDAEKVQECGDESTQHRRRWPSSTVDNTRTDGISKRFYRR